MVPSGHYGRPVSFSSSSRPSPAGARASGKAPGSNRLPSGRERRPALAALAVILILLGAAGSALIALRTGDRVNYVAITAEGGLPPGHKIVQKDLGSGDLAGATRALVPYSEVSSLIGQYTTTRLYENQYVTSGNFTSKPIPDGGALVGVSLENGRAPSESIEADDIVRIIRVPAANQDAGVPTVLVGAAVVTSSEGKLTDAKTSANTTLNVTVLVPTSDSTAVAAAAAAKTLVLVKLSKATKPEISRDSGAN